MSRDVDAKVAAPRKLARTLRLSPLVWLLGVGACTSVLGIEDLHDGPRPGTELTGGDNSTGATQSTSGKSGGGASNNSGASGAGNIGGKALTGGSGNQGGVDNEGGTGNEPSGGANPGGAGAGNDAGAGGAITPVSGPVHGKVIDFWGKPLGNITVQIADQQVSTDALGAFTVPNVTATYDLSLLAGVAGWVYQGLTRRDPTLQVFSARTPRNAYVTIKFTNAAATQTDNINLAFGTTDGNSETEGVGTDPLGFTEAPEWQGPATTSGTAHALRWSHAATGLPSTYTAYDAKPVALVDGADAAVTLDLTPKTIAGKSVTGTITPIADGTRENDVFVRFDSSASIHVAQHTPTANAFSYVVPTLTGASVTVSAWEGSYEGPRGLVHKDHLNPGDAAGTLHIPAPPTPLTPPPNATGVNGTTSFSFKGSPDNAGAFVVAINRLVSGDPQRLYIVTTQKKLTVPKVVDGAFVLTAGADYEWWVETHGSFATTDAMTAPGGFADEFGWTYVTPDGPHQQDGSYTYSGIYDFTMAP